MIKRVQVQAVNGLNILANNQWLSCIGNKPVNIGDYIYTDGKVVFGNYFYNDYSHIFTHKKKSYTRKGLLLKRWNFGNFYTFIDGNLEIFSTANDNLFDDKLLNEFDYDSDGRLTRKKEWLFLLNDHSRLLFIGERREYPRL